MKLVTCRHGDREVLGALVESGSAVLDLRLAHRLLEGKDDPSLHSMQALIEAGEAGLDLARLLLVAAPEGSRLPATEVVLLAPLPRPVQMRDFLCFETHMRQAGMAVPKLRAMAGEDPQAGLRALEHNGKTTDGRPQYMAIGVGAITLRRRP